MPTTQSDKKFDALTELFKNSWGKPDFSVPKNASWLERLGAGLYGTDATKDYVFSQMQNLPESEWTPEVLKNYQDTLLKGSATPFSTAANREITRTMANGTTSTIKGTPLKDTLGIVGANIKAHPFQTIGTGLNAAGNISGIFDNDKILGQGLGAAAGALIPKLFNMQLGPLAAVNTAMIGGNLGALFDNLRAKKEQEQAMTKQYYGG